jgi:hypothetical protein
LEFLSDFIGDREFLEFDLPARKIREKKSSKRDEMRI